MASLLYNDEPEQATPGVLSLTLLRADRRINVDWIIQQQQHLASLIRQVFAAEEIDTN